MTVRYNACMFARYLRLWLSLARFSLLRELAFRSNFVVKILVEVLWLGILLLFYATVFQKTSMVAQWDRYQYLFFVGTYFAIGGIIETLFLENCNQFADLIRTGDLDHILLKPMDEQFLVSCRTIDWSTAPNILLGVGVMGYALTGVEPFPGLGSILLFLAMLTCGVFLAYGFLLSLTALSVWFMRNQSLMEVWWLFGTVMRYPSEIFSGTISSVVGFGFWFLIPAMLVTNIPAQAMVKAVNPWMCVYMLFATVVVLRVSRRIFRRALMKYRSASS